jgi:hypothetical protein
VAKKNWRPFEEARQFARSLELSSAEGWNDYSKSGRRPPDIPSRPQSYYAGEWAGWGDFLGTGNVWGTRALRQETEHLLSEYG